MGVQLLKKELDLDKKCMGIPEWLTLATIIRETILLLKHPRYFYLKDRDLVMQIRIQTKTKKRPKILELTGELRSDVSQIYLESSDGVQEFLKTVQPNQKLELFVDDKKICNIRNPQLIDENILSIEGNFRAQTVVKDTTPKVIKSATDIFIENWLKHNGDVDMYAVLRAVFQVDPRMFQSFNMKSEDEQNKILKMAGAMIYQAIQEL